MSMMTIWRGSTASPTTLDDAVLYAPLTHTAIPTRGSITPAFTRATTETGQKWDEAGYLDFTALAGEMVFKGARREYNQLSNGGTYKSSGLFNNWTKFGTPVVTDGFAGPTGTLTAGRVVMDATEAIYTVGVNGTGRTGQIAVWLRGDVAGTIKISAANSGTSTTCNLTTEWAQFSIPAFAMTNADGVALTRVNAGQLETVYIDLAQIVDITGETDQTTIRPYVSVGVESAPAYHGSMVDGVLCSDLDRSGNPISTSGSYPLVGYVPWEARTNLCLQSNALTTTWASTLASVTQNAVGPDGGTTAWTLNDTDVGSVGEDWQNITLTAAPYTMSAFVKKTSGATTFPVMYVITGTVLAVVTIDTNNGVATVWTAYTGFTMLASASARCASYNSNYWRVELTYTATAAVYHHAVVAAGTTNATQSTGTLSATVIGSAVFYGVQVELGSFATPYIPTTTLAVARNADVLTYTGADVANIKTLACTFSRGVGVSSVGVAAVLTDGTNANTIANYMASATAATFAGVTASASQWSQAASNAYTPGTNSKMAQTWATNNIKMDKDGTAQTADTTATPPAFTQLQVGHQNAAYVFNGPVNHIYGWTRNLSQSELGAIDRA